MAQKNFQKYAKKFTKKQPVLPAEDESDDNDDEAYKAFKVATRNGDFKKATAVWQRARLAYVHAQLQKRWASMSAQAKEAYDDDNGEGDHVSLVTPVVR